MRNRDETAAEQFWFVPNGIRKYVEPPHVVLYALLTGCLLDSALVFC